MQRIGLLQFIAMALLNVVASAPIAYGQIVATRGSPGPGVNLWIAALVGFGLAILAYFIARRLIPEDPTTPPPPPPGGGYSSLLQLVIAVLGFLLFATVLFLPLTSSFLTGGSEAEHTPAFVLNFVTFLITPLAGRLVWKPQ